MSTKPLSTVGHKVWVAVRFVLFGFVGFWVMLYAAVGFMITIFDHQQEFISPLLSVPLTVVGAFMMVYGVGEWRRLAYIWVFLSIPISLFLLVLIAGSRGDKGSPVAVAALAACGSYITVRSYYASKARGRKEDGPTS